MNETEFHMLADAMLNSLFDALETADETGALDVEYEGGVMTLQVPGGKQFIVSKHTASRQIWLSSPVSGGLHFSCFSPIRGEGIWTLADGRSLQHILSQELQTLACIGVQF